MLEVIMVGIGYGLLLSVMVGPAFFVMIETSINKGIKSALFLDLGVLLSDLMYVTIAFVFFNEVSELMSGENRHFLKIIGGGFFIILGIVHVKKKKALFLSERALTKPLALSASNYLMNLLKGFMLNAVNPGVLFYWLTLMSLLPDAPAELSLTRTQGLIIYISIILVTFFGLDVLKIFGAKKLKEILTPQWMYVVNLVLGIILLVFGTLFLLQGILALLKS
ncbi:MAG: LysE family transporter [Crocinitomicaceae bacterium]|jgi:threonine/homoserine/homoserine lactone efflux protein|nr:LysE family transporter [Crocinitomicaceae bacterium]MBK6953121.1 LysE family transporter [Crocinitomicaceae bacterium]MBK9592309.1 LysE family transporter [Crocinitomicaceae bacterium]